MCDEQQDHTAQTDSTSDRRVSLPQPDAENITVLAENLPNDPVLPWHHFDSPWLDRYTIEADAAAMEKGEPSEPPLFAEDNSTDQQLSLELEDSENSAD
jgi:hypothetical protein